MSAAAADPAAGVLETSAVSVAFGGLTALSGISLRLQGSGILGLIGPNGAGKTTLVNVLTGFQRPTEGKVLLDGVEITKARPRAIARAGIARTFQNVRLFKDLSVIDNLEVSAVSKGSTRRQARDRAAEILGWMGIADRARVKAGTLAYGQERLVGIARALALAPRFMLLDEPAAGMTEPECEALMRTISAVPSSFGCGVMIIEHNMRVVMGVCQRIHVIASGRTIAEGTPQEIQSSRTVIAAYLGEKKR
jgi:branched-chain amino acid transport system ATP-binding protein